MIFIMRLIAGVIGVVGLILMLAYPPLGCVALLFGALLIVVAARAEQRQKDRAKAAIEERRHQELLAATRAGQAPVAQPAKDEKESLGKRLGSL